MCGMYDDPFNREEKSNPYTSAIAKIKESSPLAKVREEVRGARRYNEGKLDWNLLPLEALEDTVKVLMYGAHKYSIFEWDGGKEVKGVDITPEQAKGLKVIASGANNWRAGDGLTIEGCWNSMMRHIVALRRGEINDPESGLPHLGHIGCNFVFISWLSKYKNSGKS